VVEPKGVRHVFAAAVPRQGTTLDEQTHDALRTIEDVVRDEGTHGSIVQQAVFMRDICQIDQCRAIINDFYGPNLPATTYIMQPPCDGKLVSIEAMGVGQGDVQIERLGERMVVTHHDGVTWAHLANVALRTSFGCLYDRAANVFRAADEGLALRGYHFDQVIRTWLYLGDITGEEGESQRYKELNRARTDFFRGIEFGGKLLPDGWDLPVYPASTGIGTAGRNLVMSMMALETARRDVRILPLENPKQTAACDYELRYGPQSPKFARAMGVVSRDYSTTFISGTASITDSETRHLDDVEGQTNQTLDNIAALISPDNYARYGLADCGSTLDDLALMRVYIKRQEDYQKTRAICQARLGEVPTVYAVADVCRPDLLVEIEGVAFSPRRG
jgi:enamine deaminase RidA (YjgF/YER057c/UK114 family)